MTLTPYALKLYLNHPNPYPPDLAGGRKVVERGATREAGVDLMWTARGGGRPASLIAKPQAGVLAPADQDDPASRRRPSHLKL